MSTPTPQSSQARRLFTTSQAAHVILGGTDSDGFWGFTFQEFVDRLQAGMLKHIGNPADTPWRKQLDFTAEDYLQLQQVLDGMDFVRDPVDHLDLGMATSFARRCDIVGMHGGKNGIGVGKDTAASALKEHGFIAMSFADSLKASLSMTYGVPMRYFFDRELKEVALPGTTQSAQFTPRRLMQLWGTEVVRSIDPKVWLKRNLLSVASAMLDLSDIARQHPERISPHNGIRVAIPDVRFADEAAYVRDMGGFIAWVSRPSLKNEVLSNGHVSEAGIPTHPTDMQLVNEGSVAQFQAAASRSILSRFEPAPAATERRRPKP